MPQEWSFVSIWLSLPGLNARAARSGMDGAQWILEVRDGPRYHYLDRWCPEDGVAYDLGRLLMTFSGCDFGPVY
jgi:hypothetical protein